MPRRKASGPTETPEIFHRAFIGIGSNLGDRVENYREACRRIAELPHTRIVKESSLYESEPLGDAKTWFVNGVIEIETALSPQQLLSKLKAIEKAMGRKKVRGKRWGSRIIDLDILFYDREVVEQRNLKIPHKELQNRRFVLLPLSELAPMLVHPTLNMTVTELLAALKDSKKVHLLRIEPPPRRGWA
ncbi:MAG: 2-amino-4-hydroxy-6-hydroxymethyldihydropteridine diphosphokinase [Candidatus Binatia bacterium]|nr:MAG: 2-amino-4-hydroxy-6-hydroxymethyldihydropteridine diphosphokinase [Candidatus Binatia bacterium]